MVVLVLPLPRPCAGVGLLAGLACWALSRLISSAAHTTYRFTFELVSLGWAGCTPEWSRSTEAPVGRAHAANGPGTPPPAFSAGYMWVCRGTKHSSAPHWALCTGREGPQTLSPSTPPSLPPPPAIHSHPHLLPSAPTTANPTFQAMPKRYSPCALPLVSSPPPPSARRHDMFVFHAPACTPSTPDLSAAVPHPLRVRSCNGIAQSDTQKKKPNAQAPVGKRKPWGLPGGPVPRSQNKKELANAERCS